MKPTSVLGFFFGYQDLIRPMKTQAIDKKWASKGITIPPETLYRRLPGILLHPLLQKVKGQVIG
jgi:hypothetical protein